METVVSGVHQVGGVVNSYIVDGDQGIVLVDTGLPKRGGPITEKLASMGRSPTEIVAILLTHAHFDHLGGAAYFKNVSGAAVVASRADTPAVEGDQPLPHPPMIPGWLAWVTRLMPSPRPIDVDIQVAEEDHSELPDDIAVVDTPGHTPGHVSYTLDRDGGVVFVGDAAAAKKDGSVTRGLFNVGAGADVDRSIGHLGERSFETAFFGHSGPLRSGASAAFEAYDP